MAHSKTFFGLRKGSTKSSTFQIFRGQQITKDRVAKNSNPQTSRQGLQRMRVAAVSNAAARLRPLISQSFEGLPYGEESVREFMRVNMAKNGPCQFQCWPKKGENTPGLSTLMVSRGSLPTVKFSMFGNSEDYPNEIIFSFKKKVNVDGDITNEEARLSLISVFKEAFGAKDNDQVTFLYQLGKCQEHKDENTNKVVFSYYPGVSYAISRFVLNKDSEISKRWVYTRGNEYVPYFNGLPQVSDGITSIAILPDADIKLCLAYPSTKAFERGGLYDSQIVQSATIILSRYQNGRWLRSTQILPVNSTNGYVQTADEAWPSYLKTGESTKYLNEGSDSVNIIGG